jgi:hypothetical protein
MIKIVMEDFDFLLVEDNTPTNLNMDLKVTKDYILLAAKEVVWVVR